MRECTACESPGSKGCPVCCGEGQVEYTCETCPAAEDCIYAYEPANTDGYCLADK